MTAYTSLSRELRDVALEGEELTTREKQVLRLTAHGLTGPEVAKKLNVCHETVKSHYKMILPKLGARTQAQAVGIAVSLDII